MGRRYWVRSVAGDGQVEGSINGFVDFDSVIRDDYTGVLETVIRAVDPPGATGRIRQGGTWIGGVYTDPSLDGLWLPDDELSGADLLDRKRVTIARNLREHENVQGLAAWDKASSDRAEGYSRWIESNVIAMLEDGNLTDDALYAKLLAESQIPGEFWYHAYDLETWYLHDTGYYNRDDRDWTHYVTSPGGTTPNSRGGVISGLATPTPDLTAWNWPAELAKFGTGIT